MFVFPPHVALDINGDLARGSGNIYAAGDTAFATPLVPRSADGALMDATITITPLNMTPGFQLEDHPVVYWRSGNAAPVLLEAAGARIPAGGSAGQVVGKASSTDFDVAWVDPPAGGGTGGGTGGGGSVDAWSKQQTAPVITISATAPWPTDAPAGALIVRLSGAGA